MPSRSIAGASYIIGRAFSSERVYLFLAAYLPEKEGRRMRCKEEEEKNQP
jgi:hypothetical protein